jgi:hypothetical protein
MSFSLRVNVILLFSNTIRPIGADDLKSVRARGFTRGTHENTRRAIRPFQVRRDVVLDFDLVKSSQLAKAADALGHAHEPLQGIEIVQTLIQQHAAAFALPGRAPAAARVIRFRPIPVGVDPIDANDVTEVAVLNQFWIFL